MDRIGLWTMSPHGRKWHLIESEIGLDAVTRCGRRFRDSEAIPIRTHDTDLPLCFYCDVDGFGHRPTLNTRGEEP